MTVFSGVIFFGVVVWFVIVVFRAQTSLRKIFLPALFTKLIAGIGLGLLYVIHYGVGDTLLFFSDAIKLSEFAKEEPTSYISFLWNTRLPKDYTINLSFVDARALLMVKITSIFSLVSFDNFWMITTYMTLISFLGSWYLVSQVHQAFEGTTPSAIVAFLFFPSIVFWTSGLIKETLAMASLYFICGVFVRIWSSKKIALVSWIGSLVAIYLLWSLKYYFAGVFFAIILALVLYHFIAKMVPAMSKGFRSYAFWFLIFVVLIIGVTYLHPNFKAHRLLNVMIENYNTFQLVSRPGAVVQFNNLQPTIFSLIAHSPAALFAGLLRPIFFDASNALAFILSIENLLLLILTIVALRYVPNIFVSNVGVLLVAIIVYVILLAIFIALSTPNYGTLARYRVGYLPFFVFLILLAPPVATRLLNLYTKITKT